MKTIICCILALLLNLTLQAQLSIGVVCPNNMQEISSSALSKLKTKVEQVATMNGVAAQYNGGFVMYPRLEVYDVKVVEGGMKNITAASLELTLFVKRMGGEVVLNSFSTSLKGSGYTQADAVTNAISSINPRDEQYADFVSESKQRILQYYVANRERSIEKAQALAAQRKYDEAYALLAEYPESLPLYTKVSEAMVNIYKQQQNVTCMQQVQKAQVALTAKDVVHVLEILSNIDLESVCVKLREEMILEVRQLLEKEEQKAEAEKNREAEERAKALEMQLKQFDSQMELEKYRISAIKDIAKSYYEHQPDITYNQVVY